jgi:hypothetical protein
MKNKLKDYWDSTADLRASLPNFIRPKNIFSQENKGDNNEELSITQRINKNLLQYKEIKSVYNKTGISPAILLYILFICLIFIFIGYFENQLTVLIGTLYPMYISIKTLQNVEEDKEGISQWLTYWYAFYNHSGWSMRSLLI